MYLKLINSMQYHYTSLRINPSDLESIKATAKKYGLTQSELIRIAVKDINENKVSEYVSAKKLVTSF